MYPIPHRTLRKIADTLLIVGLVISFFEHWYESYPALLGDTQFPGGLDWTGWGLAAVAAVMYIAIGMMETPPSPS